MTTTLFTWNKSSYTILQIYSDPNKSSVTNATTTDVKLSAPLKLKTTLLITNTSTVKELGFESVEETYQFSTVGENKTLGTIAFITSYVQNYSIGEITNIPTLSSHISATGIFADLQNSQAIISFDNDSGIRTLSIIP
jgi:hypothetical protein